MTQSIQDPPSPTEQEPSGGIPERLKKEKKKQVERRKSVLKKCRRGFSFTNAGTEGRVMRREKKKDEAEHRVGSQREGGRFNRSHRGNKGWEDEECSRMRRVSPRSPMI